MDCLQYLIWVATHTVLLKMKLGAASEQTCSDPSNRPVQCYECSSYGEELTGSGRSVAVGHCADPFNRTHPLIKVSTCKDDCAKWVRRPTHGEGPVHYIRTCSSNLNLRLNRALVCMRESRPGEGQLCFCHRNFCNSAIKPHLPSFNILVTSLLLTVMIALPAVVVFNTEHGLDVNSSSISNCINQSRNLITVTNLSQRYQAVVHTKHQHPESHSRCSTNSGNILPWPSGKTRTANIDRSAGTSVQIPVNIN